jgi:serine phosphatase RsbU (regulator of sigma subunit)
LHRVVGEALEALYPDRLNEHAAVLARHFRLAGEDQHALAYFIRAGDAALGSYANQEAESQYRSALALGCSERQRAELLSGLGEALYGQSRFVEAMQAWHQGIQLYRQIGNLDGVARLYARSARAAWYDDDTPEGLRLCQEGIQATAGAAASHDQARLLHETARAYHFNGVPGEALPLCQQALEMARSLGAVDVEADALTTLAVLPEQPKEIVLASLNRAIELAGGAGLLAIAYRANHNKGVMTASLLGDLQQSRECFLRAAKLARRRGVVIEEVHSLVSALGHALTTGEVALAESLLQEVDRLSSTLPDRNSLWLEQTSTKAGLYWIKGRLPKALDLMRKSREAALERGNLQMAYNTSMESATIILEMRRRGITDETGEPPSLSEAESAVRQGIELADRGITEPAGPRCELSRVLTHQGHLEEARSLLAEGKALAKRHPSAWHKQYVRVAELELAAIEQRWAEALKLVEGLANAQRERGRRWHWATLLIDWADVHLKRGEPHDLERAEELLLQSQRELSAMGASGYAALVDEKLATLRTAVYARTAAQEKASQELAVAGRIQEGLLPKETPLLRGWQLTAVLEPARETSGDFYDYIPLPDGLLGIVVADVTDKGAGAALYMALSRTLIRTYAVEFPTQPERALQAANRRILDETHTDMFVTVFYGVLDPQLGRLFYCNAGHNPPFLLSGEETRSLSLTGLPLGILDSAEWEQGVAHLAPGDSLVLYTDGVLDAQGPDGDSYGRERLLESLMRERRRERTPRAGSQRMVQGVLDSVHQFVGSGPRFDDLTLLVVVRDPDRDAAGP